MKKKTNVEKVMSKILKRILRDMALFSLTDRDLKIIKDNFKFKTPAYSSLGSGITHILEDIVTPMVVSQYQDEMEQALLEDIKASKPFKRSQY
jgi:hypothetical protein